MFSSLASFYTLFLSWLLFANALAILNEQRFLRKCGFLRQLVSVSALLTENLSDGWDRAPIDGEQTVSGKLIGLLHAARSYLQCELAGTRISVSASVSDTFSHSMYSSSDVLQRICNNH